MPVGRPSLPDRGEGVSLSHAVPISLAEIALPGRGDTTPERLSGAFMKGSLTDGPRALLHDLPILKFLPPDARNLVVDSFVPESFAFGSPIVREGDEADAFYVLVSGRARVVKTGEGGEEIPLNVLRPGQSFGEMALLEKTTRV